MWKEGVGGSADEALAVSPPPTLRRRGDDWPLRFRGAQRRLGFSRPSTNAGSAERFLARRLAEKRAVDELLEADRVALVGPIVAEALLGFRRPDQADWSASRLRLARYVETGWDDFSGSNTL